MTATLHSEGDRQTLRFERDYRHPRGEVWRAVTDPELMGGWFPARVDRADGEPAAGTELTFTFEGDEEPPTHGTVLEFDEPSVFAFTWDGDTIRVELSEDGEDGEGATAGGDDAEGERRCRLTLTASFEGREWAVRNAAGWHICLDLLKATLEGREPKVSVGRRQSQLLKEYESRFGRA
ncbi:SRPBCC family protein [Streptomyces durbertensis]|uniref:SRPBCC family protein n=1 Tax=Streptomyces durbertensis TaxID=2448886 RepID=A0ABR6EJ00_9ACTN|nr:SRPBCC family protein [Streptomyces durbertensis]MBB1245277.1 SRPBCC family protein [Streptomyces durbertensis]